MPSPYKLPWARGVAESMAALEVQVGVDLGEAADLVHDGADQVVDEVLFTGAACPTQADARVSMRRMAATLLWLALSNSALQRWSSHGASFVAA